MIFSSSPEATNSALNKIKRLKIDWSKYTIEKDTTAFEETLESVSGYKTYYKNNDLFYHVEWNSRSFTDIDPMAKGENL